jgi:hypothetical protein
MKLSEKILEEIKFEKELNKKCQEALKSILTNTGYHARIVFYPGAN